MPGFRSMSSARVLSTRCGRVGYCVLDSFLLPRDGRSRSRHSRRRRRRRA